MYSAGRGSRVATLLAAVCVGALITSCSGGGSAATPAAAPADPSGTAGVPSAAAGRATCRQLTAAQVQPLLAQRITKVAVTAAGLDISPTGAGQQCAFATADSAQAIEVTVVGGKDAEPYYNSQAQSITPAAVPGIGEKAVRDSSDHSDTITAEGNGLTCSVGNGAADQIPGVAALETAAGNTSDIGDARYAVITAALGTLCNRIFGSGTTTPDLGALASAVGPSATPSAPSGGGLPTDFALPTDGSS